MTWLHSVKTILNKSSHSIYNVQLHIIFVTKYRRTVFSGVMLQRLQEIFERLCSEQNCRLLEFGGEPEHVHLLISLHPDVAISKLVNILKAVSSRLIRKEFAEELNQIYRKRVLWTHAYCVISAGGAPLEVLRNYIQGQGQERSHPPPN